MDFYPVNHKNEPPRLIFAFLLFYSLSFICIKVLRDVHAFAPRGDVHLNLASAATDEEGDAVEREAGACRDREPLR